LQVETPVVPSFDTALSEAEWLQHQSQIEREAEEQRKAAEQLLQSQLEEERLRAMQAEREQAERAWEAQLAQVLAHRCVYRYYLTVPYLHDALD
jgi:hypothetical protein